MDETTAFKVIWSGPAIDDLGNVTEYIAADNPDAAEKIGTAILEKVRNLAKHPLFGRAVPEIRRRDIREIIHAHYRIVYRVHASNKTVEIIRVWHGARGTPEI